MQAFLNEEHTYLSRKFKKYTSYWIGSFLFVSLSVGLLTTSILCDTLTHLQQSIMLEIGLLLCIFIVVFIILPAILRLVLNCLFKRRPISTGVKNLPLSYKPPPNSPAPRWALKSFRQTMAEPGTHLSSKTYT